MSTIIKVEGLSKVYRLGEVGTGTLMHDFKGWSGRLFGKHSYAAPPTDEHWALRDVNFDVQQGEVLGIIGHNGAGKSTLLKILSKVTSPSAGNVKIKGRIASLLEVGTGFHPDLSGRNNIYLNGAILGMTKNEVKRKFEEIVDFSGVEKFIDTPVKRYSSGMYVRLAFAVAAHLEPEILIVDEVLAVGDAEFQKKCLGKMKDVSRNDGRTVLFVSHNMGAVSDLCSRALYLQQGTVKHTGDTQEVIRHYLGSQKKISLPDSETLNTRDRKGNGDVLFSAFSMLDDAGNVLDSVLSGQDIEFSILLKALPQNDLKQLHVSVAITDDFEQPVFHLSTTEGNGEELNITHTAGDIEVHCALKHLPLPPGKYHVHLFCSNLSETFDDLRYATEFTVIPGNFFGNGKTLDKKWGAAYLKSQWKLV